MRAASLLPLLLAPALLVPLALGQPGPATLVFDPSAPDASTWTFSGVVEGPASGAREGAWRFDGVDDEATTSARLPFPTNATVAVWMRTGWAGGKLAGFESAASGGSSSWDRQLYLGDDGRARWGIYAGGAIVASAPGLADGDWHLLVATVSSEAGVTRVALSVDGGPANATQTTSTSTAFSGFWRLAGGARGWADASRHGHYGGDLGLVRIEPRVISADETAELYAAGPDGEGGWPVPRAADLTSDLVLALEGLRDASAYAQTLYTGDGVREEPATSATGVNALAFEGKGHIQTTLRRVDPDALTLSLWFRTSQTGGKLLGFESSTNGTSSNYDRQLYLGRDGRVHFGVYAANGTVASPGGLADGAWHHVVGVIGSRGGDEGMRLYVDGALVNRSDQREKPSYEGAWRVGGGTSSWTGSWRNEYTGLLAGVRVYERALREDEVGLLHTEGPDGDGPPAPAAPGGATLADGRMLHLDPDATSLMDLGPRGNEPNTTATLVGNGTRADPHALLFDGVDDALLTTTRFSDPDAFTISLWVNATKPGKLLGFESSQAAGSSSYDRDLYLDAQGRAAFHIYTTGGSLVSSASLLDGRWHHVVGTVGSRGGDEGMRLYVDGLLVAENDVREKPVYAGYWRAGAGGLSGPNATADHHLGGRLASLLVHDRALAPSEVTALHALGPGGTRDLHALAAPSPTVAERPTAARLAVSHDVNEDALTFTVDLAGIPESANLHAILEDGTVVELDTSQPTWRAPARAGGLYRFEALLPAEDGSMHVVASAQELVLLPLATPTQAAGALAAGVVVTSLSAYLSSRGFDLVAYLRSVLTTSGADRLRDKTKDKADFAKRLRLGSLAALVLALCAWALLYAAGKTGTLALHPFLRALLVAGLAVVALKTLQTTVLYALARSDGHGARYRFWTTGVASLALSSLVFHVPFGYPGFLQREKRAGTPPASARKDGLTGLATVSVLAMLLPLFLLAGALTRFVFAETAMSMAFGAFAVTAMPVKPMAGAAVWRWSKPASLALALTAFASYFAFQTGALPWWGLVALGVVGAGITVGIVIANLAARRAAAPDVEVAAGR